MNSSGIFSFDAPLVMFCLFVFNGVGLLTLLGLILAGVLLLNSNSRRTGIFALALTALPLPYFFLMPKAVEATGREPSEALQIAFFVGFVATCLIGPGSALVAFRRQRRVTA